MDVDALDRSAGATDAARRLRHPNFQNPSGVTTSRAKRERLVTLAAEHGFPAFEATRIATCASGVPTSRRCCRWIAPSG
jgi:hypothetical protein